MAEQEDYRGVLGAVPYALRRSESGLFKSYVVVGGLATLGVGLFVLLGLVVVVGQTAGVRGGSLTVSRAFFVVVGLFVVAPLLAPTLLVARRRRRTGATDPRYERRLAAAGYLFIASLYVALVVSAPAGLREQPSGALAPVVAALYALPRAAALLPPLACAALMAAVHYLSTR